jgi:hypothetical protein
MPRQRETVGRRAWAGGGAVAKTQKPSSTEHRVTLRLKGVCDD